MASGVLSLSPRTPTASNLPQFLSINSTNAVIKDRNKAERMDLIDKAMDLNQALGAEANKLLAKCQGLNSSEKMELLKAHRIFEEARLELRTNLTTLLREMVLCDKKAGGKENMGQNSEMRHELANICRAIQGLLDAVREEVKKKDANNLTERKQRDPPEKRSEFFNTATKREEKAAENDAKRRCPPYWSSESELRWVRLPSSFLASLLFPLKEMSVLIFSTSLLQEKGRMAPSPESVRGR